MKIIKILTCISFLLIGNIFVNAQSNAVDIQVITSPSNGDQFNTVDSFAIVVRIKNLGPNFLITADQFKINYSVGDGSPSSISVDTLITVGGNNIMQVDQVRTYTISNNIKVNGNNNYSTCVSVNGTNEYPTNSQKNAFKCVQFTVELPESSLNIEKVYYANRHVFLNLKTPQSYSIEIFNITGSKLAEYTFMHKKAASFAFEAPSNGFYFLQLKTLDGKTATAKFVVQ